MAFAVRSSHTACSHSSAPTASDNANVSPAKVLGTFRPSFVDFHMTGVTLCVLPGFGFPWQLSNTHAP
eukprot:3187498-Amphidinium_carterae.1